MLILNSQKIRRNLLELVSEMTINYLMGGFGIGNKEKATFSRKLYFTPPSFMYNRFRYINFFSTKIFFLFFESLFLNFSKVYITFAMIY